MTCNECWHEIEGDWIMVTVKDDDEYTTGVLCSSACLVDYTATVIAMEHDESHPRWP